MCERKLGGLVDHGIACILHPIGPKRKKGIGEMRSETRWWNLEDTREKVVLLDRLREGVWGRGG
jgi:hypothetical protein